MNKPEDLPFKTILLIDSTDREQTCLALVRQSGGKKYCVAERAQELPKIIETLLNNEQITNKNLDAIAVITSGGSLTGMRIGVAVTNTLAWKWRLPVIPVDEQGFDQAINKLSVDRFPEATRAITDVD